MGQYYDDSLDTNPHITKKERYVICVERLYKERGVDSRFIEQLLDICEEEITDDSRFGDVLYLILSLEDRGYFSHKHVKKVTKKIHKWFIEKNIPDSELGVLRSVMITGGSFRDLFPMSEEVKKLYDIVNSDD